MTDQEKQEYEELKKKSINGDMSIKQALQTALKQQLASKSKKVRAVDDKTNAMIDMLQG